MEPSSISFELLQFTDQAELTRIVESFCKITGLAGGIVLMPPAGTARPLPESDLSRYRATIPEVVNASRFCAMIRACSHGNQACMDSDLKNAGQANECGKAVHYSCHMRIFDLMAPIRVCGRHVANVYLGQIRPEKLDVSGVVDRYKGLLTASGELNNTAKKEAELRRAFRELPSANKEQLDNYRFFVETLAALISQRATRQATIKMAVAATREVGGTVNQKVGLETFLKYAIALLNGDTGSIFLIDANDPNRIESQALAWGNHTEAELRFTVHGSGIIAENARNNLELLARRAADPTLVNHDERSLFVSRFKNRGEIDKHGPEQAPGTRDRRRLESLLVVPILCGDEFLGTLDVGSRKEDAFCADDEHVLRLFASVIGANTWTLRQRHRLVHMFGKHNARELMQAIVSEVPREVNGLGCSVFILGADNVAELTASTEFEVDFEVGKTIPSYRLGEGFTGWVLQRGIPLRVRSGKKCRSDHLDPALKKTGLKWSGRHRDLPLKLPRDYFEDRPFLAVPVRTPDGRVCGVIRIGDRRSGDFSLEDERTVQVFADFLGHFVAPTFSGTRQNFQGGKPRVFLGHGQTADTTQIVRSYLAHFGCEIEKYDERAAAGEFSFDIVYKMIRDSNVAVILYTGDDVLEDGHTRVARRNVAHELGLAQGILGPRRVVLLLENGVEKPTNVEGMQHISFQKGNVQGSFATLGTYLTKAGLVPPGAQ